MAIEDLIPSPCEPKQRREKARKMLEDFQEDVIDTFNELASLSFGSFIPTLFALTAQLTAGAALNYAAFLGSSVARNSVGGLISSVGLAIGLMNGSKVMLKYLAAKELETSLHRRLAFAGAMQDEVNHLLDILLAFEDINIATDMALLSDVEAALPHVKRAASIVGREKSRLKNLKPFHISQEPVGHSNLYRAVEHIDEASSILSGQYPRSSEFIERLNELNSKYQLRVIDQNAFTSAVGIVNP